MKDLILREQPYIAQCESSKVVKKQLVLADEHGNIRAVARDPCQDRKITALGARIKVDPETCQSIVDRGFPYSIVCGGIHRNPVTGQREYRRVQIFKSEKWRRWEVGRMHTFFKRHLPKERIGFYILHNGNLYTPKERLK
jgi:hypothetical protein